jgi:hypothetical protein
MVLSNYGSGFEVVLSLIQAIWVAIEGNRRIVSRTCTNSFLGAEATAVEVNNIGQTCLNIPKNIITTEN